ncbi:MAG: hypothetical protein NZZ41_00955 [Candidatus Dojkabacteria bacterium]|nr:hypothetical protein [Candidatus Dojkabacteria bacterium]
MKSKLKKIKNINELYSFVKNNHKVEFIDQKNNKIKIVFNKEEDREKIANDLASKYYNIEYVRNSPYSSIGHMILNLNNNKFLILLKSSIYRIKKGYFNEISFYNNVKNFLQKEKKNIYLVSLNRKKIYKNIKDIILNKENKKNIKADVYLVDENNFFYPISIKKRNFSFWESADSNEKIKNSINFFLEKDNNNLLFEDNGIFKIKNYSSIWFDIDENLKKEIVFGKDLLKNKGCVIIGNFEDSVFLEKNQNIYIFCDMILSNVKSIKDNNDIGIMLFNCKTRRTKNFFPGIRIVSVNKSRISSRTYLTNLKIG